MKIKITYIGKTKSQDYVSIQNEFRKRLRKFVDIDIQEIDNIKSSNNLNDNEIKKKEAEKLIEIFKKDDFIILLDEKGKQFTSREFANYIEDFQINNSKIINLVIGGSYGFSPEIYKIANDKIALSKMTFSHQMVRIFIIEQIYRAFSIINNLPYHND